MHASLHILSLINKFTLLSKEKKNLRHLQSYNSGEFRKYIMLILFKISKTV